MNRITVYISSNLSLFTICIHNNIRGFEVIKDQSFCYVYKHSMFRKGDWEACMQMKLPSFRAVAGMSQADNGNHNAAVLRDNHAASNLVDLPSSDSSAARSITPPVQLLPEFGSVGGAFQSYQGAAQPSTLGRMSMNNRRATVDSMASVRSMFGSVKNDTMPRRMGHFPFSRRASLSFHPGQHILQSQQLGNPSNINNFQCSGMMSSAMTKPTLSDADILSATQKVVSAAIEAISCPKFRRITIEHESLDTMTDMLLARQRFVISNTTSSAIVKPRSSVQRQSLVASVGADVEARTRVLLANSERPAAA